MIISESEAKKLTDRILGLSKADSCVVSVAGHERGHIRMALNSVTTSGLQDNLSVSITSNFGKRSGAVSTNELDDASLASAVKKSEEIARLAPEDPEFQEPLGPQKYLESRVYFDSTAQARPEKLAALARPLVEEAIAQKVTGAGFLQAGTQCSALATSKGLFVYEKSTGALCTVSARTSDGTGSGWAGGNQNDIERLQTVAMAKAATQKAFESRKPNALEPGKYTVVLEPSAVCDLIGLMIGGHFDARNADEGRSFLSKKGGGNKLGEKICGAQVNLYGDPHHEPTPGSIYSTDGLPAVRRNWIKDGVVSELITSRFWAQKTGRAPVPYPTNLVMTGGTTSVQQMIENTQRGVLVTRFWYIREVDPRTLLFTGLTRDGTFLVENGKIARPIKNFRFNESVVAMLNNVVAMGPSVRAVGSEVEDWSVCVPPLLVRDFTFSSLSEAV
jgi:predicted Zn-dependent protease